MRTGVTSSVIAHAALLIVVILGLGSAKPLVPEVVESIAVELVPISDVTNIRQGSLDSEVVDTPTPAVVETDKPAELAKPTGNTEQDQVAPEETAKPTPAPVVNTAPAPAPTPDIAPDPTPPVDEAPPPAPAPTPDPAAPVADPQQEVATDTADAPPAQETAPVPAVRPPQLRAKPKPVEVPKKPVDTPKKPTETPKPPAQTPKATPKPKPDDTAKPADQVAALINSENSRGAQTGAGGSPTLGKNTGRASTLTQTQIDGLIAQIKNCPYYNPPFGAADAGATAQLSFSIDASGNVTATPQILSLGASQMERALASAAQRGVMRCGPYAMAVSQDVKATFDPRLM